MEYPKDLRYTKEHEWARAEGDGRVRVGITDYAQDQPFGEVESTKSVSDVYAPVSGTVIERNGALEDRPELVNEQPYRDGWMIAIEAEPGSLDGLLDAEAYEQFVRQEQGQGQS